MTIPSVSRVLDYWHSGEFFNYYSLDEQLEKARESRRNTVCLRRTLNGSIDGWQEACGRPGDLYLVPFDVTQATRMVERHVEARSEVERIRDEEMASEGLTCFAKVRLGQGGCIIADTLSISALPWALGRLRAGALEDLCAGAIDASLTSLKEDIAALVARVALDAAQLLAIVDRLHRWADYAPAGDALAWAVIAPSADPQKGAPSEPQEPDEQQDLPILNSFYVRDLIDAQRELQGPHPPRALQAYLSLQDAAKLDLETLTGQQAILDTLRPVNGIAGRWPSPAHHHQALMQQFALNRMKALGDGEILAVNGPPGTGKTTLLRDLVAHLVVERAKVLASFDQASDGLSDTTVEAVFPGGKSHRIPVLSAALTGSEIVVASSNNRQCAERHQQCCRDLCRCGLFAGSGRGNSGRILRVDHGAGQQRAAAIRPHQTRRRSCPCIAAERGQQWPVAGRAVPGSGASLSDGDEHESLDTSPTNPTSGVAPPLNPVDLSVFDISAPHARLVQTLPTGLFPREIATIDHGRTVFVSDFGSSTVSVFRQTDEGTDSGGAGISPSGFFGARPERR